MRRFDIYLEIMDVSDSIGLETIGLIIKLNNGITMCLNKIGLGSYRPDRSLFLRHVTG